jgi:RNA methyltransferase, TrmH family
MLAQISSLQNQRVKQLVKLNHRQQRDSEQRALVEGVREVTQALNAGLLPYEAYICPALIESAEAGALVASLARLAEQGKMDLFEVTTAVFQKIAYRGDSGGILLVIPYWQRPLTHLSLSDNPFLVVIEAVEKPGNLGAILRTADAAGVDGLVVCEHPADHATDIHNPNVIRASLGASFTVPTAVAETNQLIAWLSETKIPIVAATPTANMMYTEVDLTTAVAIVMGSEAHGLSDAWLRAAQQQVLIPMSGAVDSLNLSVATALLLYEVVRQRRGRPFEHKNPG